MEFCIKDIKRNRLSVNLSVYPDEFHHEDIITDNFCEQVRDEFGMRGLRGTAVAFHNRDSNLLLSMERVFRSFLANKQIIHAVEIGTWRGVSTALIAHYAEKVTTIDITYYPVPLTIWMYFGVRDKIKYDIVENNEAKKQLIDRLDFDFAFIDGDHNYDEVAYDFELVKRCGRVLFHDWDMQHCPGVTRFVETLPESELSLQMPFAYWQKNGQNLHNT